MNIAFSDLVDGVWNMWKIFAVTVLCAIALSMFQLLLSSIIKPIYSYMVMCAYLVAGAYIQSPLLIGNYLMGARSNVIVTTGLKWSDGMLVSIWIIMLSVIVGMLFNSKKDILNRSNTD